MQGIIEVNDKLDVTQKEEQLDGNFLSAPLIGIKRHRLNSDGNE